MNVSEIQKISRTRSDLAASGPRNLSKAGITLEDDYETLSSVEKAVIELRS